MGVVGRFQSPGFSVYRRDAQVICRTNRGLECGTVICHVDHSAVETRPIDGEILRRVGKEDRLILERLERHRDKAYSACKKLIEQHELDAILVDVEHLFDGESVYFYFLGNVDPRIESLTNELGAAYERKAKFKKFAETLANGCGPDCGTGESKCSTGGCSSCSLRQKCGK